MIAIAEIDKAGRLVVPKKMRDALHLIPGTRVALHLEGDKLTVEMESGRRGLQMKDGILVYTSSSPCPLEDIDWAAEDRDARMQELLGAGMQK